MNRNGTDSSHSLSRCWVSLRDLKTSSSTSLSITGSFRPTSPTSFWRYDTYDAEFIRRLFALSVKTLSPAVQVNSPYLEDHLMHMIKQDQSKVRNMDLLWRYYEKNRSFGKAAHVLARLADMHRLAPPTGSKSLFIYIEESHTVLFINFGVFL